MLLLVIASTAYVVSSFDLPRGVPPSRSAFYERANEFQCLDGSLRIPFDQVNDDYCDCPDGSDEPGTSACPNGRYFCHNKLHEGQLIPSSRVNDGICDCCDGSDEYGGVAKCENICEEIGRSARQERERKAAIAAKGFEARKGMANEGKRLKEEKEAASASLTGEKETLEKTRQEIEGRKKEKEDKEKEARDAHTKKYNEARDERKKLVSSNFFTSIDIDKNGLLTVEELKELPYLDANGDGTVDENEVVSYLNDDKVADMEHFAAHVYDNIKHLKKDHERKQFEEQPPKEGEEEGDDIVEEHAAGDDDDVPLPPYTDEEKAIFDEADAVRKEWQQVDDRIREIDIAISDANAFTGLDFGTEFEWAPLKGKCFEHIDKQYTYKLCPFDRTTQRDTNGHSETTLGRWKEWTEPYTVGLFSGGQQCWNGPERSTKVHVECGDTDELVHAEEPGRCEYLFVFRTPAVCEDPAKEQPVHAEL